MDKNPEQIGEVHIYVDPDFTVIKPYLFKEMKAAEFKREVKKYRVTGAVSLPFLTLAEGEKLGENLRSILNTNPLTGHESNIAFMVLYLYSTTSQRYNDTLLPANESSVRVKEFIANFEVLVKNIEKDYNITITEKPPVDDGTTNYQIKKKPLRIKFNNAQTSKWIIDTLLSAVEKGKIPLSLGTQLFKSGIFKDDLGNKVFKSNVPERAFVHKTERELFVQEILSIAVPILNYLESETLIKKGGAKYWSNEQLSFVLEVLFATGIMASKIHSRYKFGVHKPDTSEKNTLRSILKGAFVKV